jgi:hypothetical protein
MAIGGRIGCDLVRITPDQSAVVSACITGTQTNGEDFMFAGNWRDSGPVRRGLGKKKPATSVAG